MIFLIRNIGLCLVASAVLAGCASHYKEPPYSKVAKLKIDHVNATKPSYTRVDVYDNPYCAKGYFSGQAAKIGSGLTRKEGSEIVRLGTGEEVFLAFKGWSRGYDDGDYKQHICVNLISFVPQENATYSAHQTISINDSCKVVLIDDRTGETLESVTRYSTPKECVKLDLY